MRVSPNLKRRNVHEGHTTQRRTDHCDSEGRGSRVDDRGFVPSARDHGTDLLSLEGEVRGYGKRRGEEAEATGRREPEAEARGGGVDAGQSGVERRALKKLVGPAGLRRAAGYVIKQYAMSERHAC